MNLGVLEELFALLSYELVIPELVPVKGAGVIGEVSLDTGEKLSNLGLTFDGEVRATESFGVGSKDRGKFTNFDSSNPCENT